MTDNMGIALRDELNVQQQYVDALIQAKPGLGEKSKDLANELVLTGLSPNEALMLINLAYNPSNISGKGQGTRVKYFSEALLERYGDTYLHNISQSVVTFKRFLASVGEAVEMRNDLNAEIGTRVSFSFKDILKFQELGLGTEEILGYFSRLTSDYGKSYVGAIMSIKQGVDNLVKNKVGNLESLLFPAEMDRFVEKSIIGDEDEKYRPYNLAGDEID